MYRELTAVNELSGFLSEYPFLLLRNLCRLGPPIHSSTCFLLLTCQLLTVCLVLAFCPFALTVTPTAIVSVFSSVFPMFFYCFLLLLLLYPPL